MLNEDATIQEQVDAKLGHDAQRERPIQVVPNSYLYQSIGAVMAAVRRLERTERNNHGKYEFTPADAFRDFIREQFIKNDLVYAISEVYSSQASEGLKAGVIKFQYEFYITHIGTGESTPKELRSVFLPYVGSQTAGIASTFALKEWLKNKFLISTGEPDPEGKMGEADERAGDKLTSAESEEATAELGDALEALIKEKPTRARLEAWREDALPILSQLQNQHFLKLNSIYTKAHKAAPEQEAA